MNEPRVGLMTFGDARAHEWENLFRGLTEPRHRQMVEYLQALPLELHCFDEVARTAAQIDAQAARLKAAGAELLVAHVPCWTSPNLVVRGVHQAGLPTVLVSNREPGTHGTVGLLGAGGALDQIGYPHQRIRANLDGPAVADQLLPFARAASAAARLRGQVFGLFGGRSLGIDTGSIDPMQWRRQFGIDVEHVDQLEIVRRAELVPDEAAERLVSWLEDKAAAVHYDGRKLTRERLGFQARCYLATRDIAAELGLDFLAVKCMPDLSTHYVPQCLSAALLPGPYDADGAKAPMAMACEADADGALSMHLLQLVSGGAPTLFGDVSHLDEEAGLIYIPNCGAQCSWYAARSADAAENMGRVELRPSFRPGGGATVYFVAAPGPITLARLYRRAGQYVMAIIPGDVVEPAPEAYRAFVEARGSHQLPTAFVRVSLDFDELIAEFGSNHISGVAGTFGRELEHVCRLLDIRPVVLGR